MKKLSLSLFLVLILSSFQFASAQVKWTVDPAHTNARFEVKHLGIAFVDGEFTTLEGEMESQNAEDFNNSKVSFTIDVNSISTRVEDRDNHLKSDDFFNVEKYPNMTLKNAVLTRVKGSEYKLTGDLTIRDVTKKVTFDVVQNNGVITDPWGGTRIGFTATSTINRFDFNIAYNDNLPSGVPAVAPNIKITVNVELVKN